MIGGVILTASGIAFLILTIFLTANLELWADPGSGLEWKVLFGFVGSPALIFAGIRRIYFEYRWNKLSKKQ